MAKRKAFVVTTKGGNRPLYIVITTKRELVKYRMAKRFSNVKPSDFDDTYELYQVEII